MMRSMVGRSPSSTCVSFSVPSTDFEAALAEEPANASVKAELEGLKSMQAKATAVTEPVKPVSTRLLHREVTTDTFSTSRPRRSYQPQGPSSPQSPHKHLSPQNLWMFLQKPSSPQKENRNKNFQIVQHGSRRPSHRQQHRERPRHLQMASFRKYRRAD